MKSPMSYDERYKINQSIVNQMRQLRLDGWTYQKIADRFEVSYFTAYYWTNDKYRKHKKKINAQRRRTDEEEKQERIKKQNKRRKKRWRELPETKIECDYWSAKCEKRVKRHSSKGRTIKELEDEYERTKAETNQKVF